MALGLGFMAMFIPLPKSFFRAGKILGVAILLGIVVFIFIVARHGKEITGGASGRSPKRGIVRKALRFIGSLTSGVRNIGKSQLLPSVLALSLLKLAVQTLAFYTMMWAYGFRLSIWTGIAVFLIAHLGTSVPSTPASVGMFQFFCVAGLKLFGVAKPAATGFSLLAFVLLMAPLWVVGFFALAQSGVNLGHIRRDMEQLKQSEPMNPASP